MDLFSLMRTLGALGLVLGVLAAALWVVKRYDLRLPGRVSTTRRRRVELVERLSVDAKRSLALIRRDGCEHLVLIGPDGHAVIETGIETVTAPAPPPEAPPAAPALPANFARFIELTPPSLPSPSPRRREFGHSARWNRAAVREALGA